MLLDPFRPELRPWPTTVSDAPTPPSSRSTDAGITVRGGPSSIHANLAELEHGTALLAEQVDTAMSLSVRAGGCGALLAVAMPHVGMSGLAGLLGARTAELSAGLAAIGAEAAVLETGVRSSAQAYREAEARAQEAVDGVLVWLSVPWIAGHVALNRPLPVEHAERTFNAVPEIIAWGLNKLAPGLGLAFDITSSAHARQYRDAGRSGQLNASEQLWPMLHWLGGAMGVVQIGRVAVTGASSARATRLDGSLTGLMEHQRGSEQERAGSGAVQVSRVDPDAATAPDQVFVVSLPGTQDAAPDESGWSTNPFDVGGIAEAMVLDSQHVSAAVDEALVQSGARAGDTVVFTGYSQGGIHAARLAADPRIAQVYDVQGVLTVGAPTGDIDLSESVEALHLEDGEDVVVAGEGKPNPQGPRRTTVVFPGDAGGMGPDRDGILAPHAYDNYLHHAEQLQGTEAERRLAPTLEHLSALTTGTAVSRTFTLERQQSPAPRHPLEAPGRRDPQGPSAPARPDGTEPPGRLVSRVGHR